MPGTITLSTSDIQEALVSLYLRLNGYFTSGLIIHSPQTDGKCAALRTQVDVLAVRFPYNREPEREIGPSAALEVSTTHTDFIIGEVKSGGQKAQFNRRLREQQHLVRVLRWMGAFHECEVEELAKKLVTQMQPKPINSPDDGFITVCGPRSTRIRAILFHLGREYPRDNQPRFIGSGELMDFTWSCLRPDEKRKECRTQYDFTAWGLVHEPIVRYFKDERRGEPGSASDLVKHVECRFQGEQDGN